MTTNNGIESELPIVRVLVVDDDCMVLRVLCAMLKMHGCEVASTSQPREALRLFQNSPGGFEAVVSDIRMPQLNGIEFGRLIRDIRSDMPLLFVSGTGPPPELGQLPGVAAGFLDKPVHPKELIQELNKLMHS